MPPARGKGAKAAAPPRSTSSASTKPHSSSKAKGKARTGDPDAPSTSTPLPPSPPGSKGRSLRGAAAKRPKIESENEEDEELDDDDDEDGEGGETRCVCGQDSDELNMTMMIQCDTCKCWQHGSCVGLWEERDCPDRYFCEMCRPGWHGPGGILRKAHRKVSASNSHKRSPSASLPPSSVPPTSTSAPVAAAPAAPAKPSPVPPPPTTSHRKPRESADSAIAHAFLMADQVVPPSPDRSGDPTATAATPGAPVVPAGPAKKRSTMNSRDAAYDDAIAMSILGPGSAAMRARLEKATDRSMSREMEDHSDHSRSEKDDPTPTQDVDDSLAPASKRRKTFDASSLVEPTPSTASTSSTSTPLASFSAVPDARTNEQKDHAVDERDVKMEEIEDKAPPTDANHHSPSTTDQPAVIVDAPAEQEEDDAMDAGDQYATTSRNASPTILPPPPPKAKHPNQYTYRPKPAPVAAPKAGRASPVKRTSASSAAGSSVSSSAYLNTHHGHGASGRGGDSGSDAGGSSSDRPLPGTKKGASASHHGASHHQPPSASKSSARERDAHRDVDAREENSWGLPEHLRHLAHLLPSSAPDQLAVPSSTKDRDALSASSTSSPSASTLPSSLSSSDLPTHLEPATKVRFPSKRMTMPEMKKRAKHVLEYLARVQVELSEGSDRRSLGRAEDKSLAAGNEEGASMRMMDDLTKELMLFQQKYFGSFD